MATQEKYERRPLDGFAARGFSAAYDQDRARAEKELARTMAGPSDSCTEIDKSTDAELQPKSGPKAEAPAAMGGRTAHDVTR